MLAQRTARRLQVLLVGENRDRAMLRKLGFSSELAPDAAPAAAEQLEAAAALLQNAQLSDGDDGAAGGANDDFFNSGLSPRGASPDADGDDFFGKLADGGTGTLRSNKSGVSDSGALDAVAAAAADGAQEAELQRFLFVGNHAAAVDTCLGGERFADALVIAHISGDGELWRSALRTYMAAYPHPYLRVVESQVCPCNDALFSHSRCHVPDQSQLCFRLLCVAVLAA